MHTLAASGTDELAVELALFACKLQSKSLMSCAVLLQRPIFGLEQLLQGTPVLV